MSDPTLDVLNSISQNGIKIQMVAAQDWSQYWLMLAVTVIGSIFVFIYLALLMKPQLSTIVAALALSRFRKMTGNHVLVIKHTMTDLFSMSMIDQSTLTQIGVAMRSFKGEPFDVILHTPGGSIFAAQMISRLFRAYPGKIRAVVPSYAMSGGTFLALSCDEILLADTAALGVIDPQLGYLWRSGSAKSWKQVVDTKGKKCEDASIQMAFIGEQYSRTLHNQVSELLADRIPDATKRDATAGFLTDGAVEHGRPLMTQDLKGIGIDVVEISPDMLEIIMPILSSSLYEGVYWK